MLDTLKLANRLTGAGMERGQAETLADELNAQLREGLASKADIQDLRGALNALRWQVLFGVAVLLLAHGGALWWQITELREAVARLGGSG